MVNNTEFARFMLSDGRGHMEFLGDYNGLAAYKLGEIMMVIDLSSFCWNIFPLDTPWDEVVAAG